MPASPERSDITQREPESLLGTWAVMQCIECGFVPVEGGQSYNPDCFACNPAAVDGHQKDM